MVLLLSPFYRPGKSLGILLEGPPGCGRALTLEPGLDFSPSPSPIWTLYCPTAPDGKRGKEFEVEVTYVSKCREGEMCEARLPASHKHLLNAYCLLGIVLGVGHRADRGGSWDF